jgi:hypothetical protein
MKRLLPILVLLSATAVHAQLSPRPIVRTNDILETQRRDAISWYGGESVRYEVFARAGGVALTIPTNSVAMWYVTDVANTAALYYVFATGTVVSATNGHVRYELPSVLSAITAQTYESQAVIYDASPTGQPPQVVIDRAQAKVLWKADYSGIYRGPVAATNIAVLDANTPVLTTFWTANATNLSAALGINDATSLQARITAAEEAITDLQSDLAEETNARAVALAAEISNRTAAVEAEASARASAITALGDVYVLRGNNPDEPSITGLDEVGARQFTGTGFSTADGEVDISSGGITYHGLTLDISGADHRLRAPGDGSIYLGAGETNIVRVTEDGFFVLGPMEVNRTSEFWDEVYFSKRYKTNRTTRVIRTAASSLTASTPQTVPTWTNISPDALSSLVDTRVYVGYYTSGISLVTYTGLIGNAILSLMYSTDSNEWVQFSSSDDDTVSAIAKVGQPAHLAIDAQFLPVPPDSSLIVTARLTGIDVRGWMTPDAVGQTEDLTGLHVLFDDPEDYLEPVNLRTLDRELERLHGNIPFSSRRATGPINLDRNQLVFGPQWSASQTNQTLLFSYIGQPVMELHNGATVAAEIIAYGQSGGTNWMSVVSTPIHRPVLQYSEDFISWTEYGSYDTAEQDPGVWLLSWVDGSGDASYFRAVVTGDVSVASRAVLRVPLDMNGRAISNAVLEAGILRSIAGSGLQEVGGRLALDLTGIATGAPLYEVDLSPYATGTPIYTTAGLATGTPLYQVDLSPYATGTPIYTTAGLATGTPLYQVDLSPYATGTPIYTTAGLATGTPLYQVDLSPYATGTPIYTTAGLATGTPLYQVDLSPYATGTPIYTTAGLATGTPLYQVDLSPYATGTPIYTTAGLATGTPLYQVDLSPYATGTPIYTTAGLATGTPLYQVDLSPYATGTPIYTTAGLATGTPLYQVDLSPYATGTPIYTTAGLATGTPLYQVDLSPYATGTPIYTTAGLATGTPLYQVDLSPYATGTPIYTTAGLATGTPLYQVDLSPYATGTPIYTMAGLATGAPLYEVDLSPYAPTSAVAAADSALSDLIASANTLISNLWMVVSNSVDAARLGGSLPEAYFLLSDFQSEMTNRMRMVSGVTNASSPGGFAWVQLVSTGGGTNELWVYGDHALGTNMPGWAIFDSRAP